MPEVGKRVYLTFDDGPIPEVTEFVLDVLKAHHIKATFFCIGKNAELHPDIFKRILDEGHAVGNHTHSHINGWNSNTRSYVDDAIRAGMVIDTRLFRPPYGRIRKEQADEIMLKYKVVMWDVLSYDFDKNISPQQCLKNVTENVRPGSIVVFHDSLKAKDNMQYALPLVIEKLKNEGYEFLKLE
jgi:peptidoglycan-N-acetylglucosamine deacetylase